MTARSEKLRSATPVFYAAFKPRARLFRAEILVAVPALHILKSPASASLAQADILVASGGFAAPIRVFAAIARTIVVVAVVQFIAPAVLLVCFIVR